MKFAFACSCAIAAVTVPFTAQAQDNSRAAKQAELEDLRDMMAQESASLDRQMAAIEAQRTRLRDLEIRLAAALDADKSDSEESDAGQSDAASPQVSAVDQSTTTRSGPPGSSGPVRPSGDRQTVGVAPEDHGEQPDIAALGRRGNAITRQGQLSGEVEWSYARSDRNTALFSGVEVVESVLVGVFDINENRQDVLTQTVGLRYGLLDGLEVGVNVPVIARWNTSILTPVAGSTDNDAAATTDTSAKGFGVGDIEVLLRTQLYAPRGPGPYIVGNLQVTVPTGEGPFSVLRDSSGEALVAATGSGFWGVTPGATVILPSDPGVLFGSISYTSNFARNVDTTIPPVRIIRVGPGDAISFSGGIGLSLNPRLSVNFGYAHTWGFGTRTTTLPITGGTDPVSSTSRDLQIGRLLFGTTYRLDQRTSFNWGVEMGVTDDATDLRMVLRFPFQLID